MRKIFTVIIVLIICFFIGFSIPYIYNNYGLLLDKYVNGNGASKIENGSHTKPVEESEEKEKLQDEKVDYSQYLIEAEDHFYQGDYEKSIDTYLKLYKEGYDKLEVIKNIVSISDYSDNRNKQVNSILTEAEQEYNESLDFNYYYGLYLYQKGHSNKAKDVFNHLIVLLDEKEARISSRKVSLMYYYLGNIYNEQNDKKTALNLYQAGIDSNKEMVLNYLTAAEIYDYQDNYDKAIEMYQAALNQDHSLSGIYYELALLYEKRGELLKAYQYWDRCVNSGIETAQARKRIKDIRKRYPDYFDKKDEDKPVTDIDWIATEKIEPNQTYGEIKIGLQDNLDRIRFQSKNEFTISQADNVIFRGESNTQYQINYRNHTFYILKDNEILERVTTNKKLKIQASAPNNLFALYDIKFAQSYFWGGTEDRQYRGDIYLNPVSNQYMDLINHIDLTSYMLSVVPSEMPASWPIEALKAQSVVARSYIIRNINRHKEQGYDLCADVHCIVYSGAKNEHKRTTEAIIATRNEIITHKGEVVDAVFSSNSGGYTEASENVWIRSLDYLKAVNTAKNDKYNFPLKPYQVENWFVEKPASYSNNKYTTQSSFRWVKKIEPAELKERHNLEEIKRVYITDRTTTGTVKEIKIEGVNKTITKNNLAIRRALSGLKSNKFIIKNIYEKDRLKSIIIFGAGWGHAVGMDQSAAAGMALDEKGYKEIINYFYPDTEITKLQ